jgi:hypothetical protein
MLEALSMRRSVVMSAALGLLAMETAGQVVTPPPAPRPKEVYTPPPPPPPPPAFDPTTVDFEPIYGRDEDGSLVLPARPAEIAAVLANPLLPEDIRPVVEALLAERNKQLEVLIVQNPREALTYAGGAMDRLDVSNQDSLSAAAEIAQKLSPRVGPIKYLSDQGVITPEMQAMSLHIWQDLYQTVLADLTKQAEGSSDTNELLNLQSRFLMNVSLAETGEAFDRLARQALQVLDNPEAAAALELSGLAFRQEAGAILSRLSDERLNEVLALAAAR